MYVNKKKSERNTRKWMRQAQSRRPVTGQVNNNKVHVRDLSTSYYFNHTDEHGFINKLLERYLWTRETTSTILLSVNRAY